MFVECLIDVSQFLDEVGVWGVLSGIYIRQIRVLAIPDYELDLLNITRVDWGQLNRLRLGAFVSL